MKRKPWHTRWSSIRQSVLRLLTGDHWELWDLDSANMIGDFDTLDEALDVIRDIRSDDPRADLKLLHFDSHWKLLGEYDDEDRLR